MSENAAALDIISAIRAKLNRIDELNDELEDRKTTGEETQIPSLAEQSYPLGDKLDPRDTLFSGTCDVSDPDFTFSQKTFPQVVESLSQEIKRTKIDKDATQQYRQRLKIL